MTSQNNSQNVRELQPHEIKSLVQNQGKTNIAGNEWKLNNPQHNDSTLQTIVNDPQLSAKLLGAPTQEGECTYELQGNGKSLKIKVKLQNSQQQR
jgi:hypothetical protein